MSYNNNLRGVLFKNKDKQSPKHPDYRGNCEIDGKQFWLDAWIKTSKAGDKFMSLSFKPKMAQEHKGASRNPPPRQSGDPGFGDDSPF